MELRQLRYFIHAAEMLNFTEAAKASFITESTLSQQIKQLETELGSLLFKREKKKVFLTEAGQRLLPYARRIIADAEDSIQLVKDLQLLRTGTLRIGCTYSFTSQLTGVLLDFCKAYPDVSVAVERHTANKLIELLNEHKLDVVICFEPHIPVKGMKCVSMFQTQLCVVVHHSHPLSKADSVTLDQLKQYSVILPNRTIFTRTVLDRGLQYKHQSIDPQLEWNDVNLALHLLATGHWLTVLPQSTVKDENDFRSIPIKDLELSVKAVIMSLKDGYEKSSTQAFLQLLNSWVENNKLSPDFL